MAVSSLILTSLFRKIGEVLVVLKGLVGFGLLLLFFFFWSHTSGLVKSPVLGGFPGGARES